MNARHLLVLPALLALGTGVARADPFDTLDALDQGEFRSLAENLAAGMHYKGITPAEPLGTLGFDVGLEISSTEIDESLFDRASDGDFGAGSLLLPRLHAHKGLPFGLDIGAFVGAVPSSDMTLAGAELRMALLEGGVATPAVSVRGSYSRLMRIDELDLNNAALELTVSKGILMLTPYAGVGFVHSKATPRGTATLDEESFDQTKLYVGLNVNLFPLNLTAEADRTGDHSSISAKLGVRF